MRGYCPECKEYRSDEGENAWALVWKDGLAFCQKCGSVVDIWADKKCEKEPPQETEDEEDDLE
jgi:hypothetical protein